MSMRDGAPLVPDRQHDGLLLRLGGEHARRLHAHGLRARRGLSAAWGRAQGFRPPAEEIDARRAGQRAEQKSELAHSLTSFRCMYTRRGPP